MCERSQPPDLFMGEHLTDEELVANAREGDNEAFRELVGRYESLVAGTVIGMLGKCAEADDVGQETFIRFYRSPDQNAGAGIDEDGEVIRRAVGKLDEKFRSVIVLRLIDGYSTEETAKILKIPVGTVLSRLSRAQQKLKELLTPYYGVET